MGDTCATHSPPPRSWVSMWTKSGSASTPDTALEGKPGWYGSRSLRPGILWPHSTGAPGPGLLFLRGSQGHSLPGAQGWAVLPTISRGGQPIPPKYCSQRNPEE